MGDMMINRREALEKYEEAKKKGEVDEDIVSLLDTINSSKNYYTTSSCSGRIVLFQIPEIGDKVNANFIGKWHREVEYEEIKKALEDYTKGYLFLLVQSAIIHVVADSLERGKEMIALALESGFKYTSIKNIKNGKVLVEILSTENIHIPLGKNGELMVDEKALEFFVEMANKTLQRIKRKLKNLEKNLRRVLPFFS